MQNPAFPLPADLPVPEDDGAAAHLPGMALPAVKLTSTDNRLIDLAQLSGRHVIYVYPMTGQPGVALPAGWNDIPGARGCTPQSCAFRDHSKELAALDTGIYGLSVQSTAYQREAHERLHLPFALLSDPSLALQKHLQLPTFDIAGMTLYKRLTLITEDAKIVKVFYPVFPPDRNAEAVIAWLEEHP